MARRVITQPLGKESCKAGARTKENKQQNRGGRGYGGDVVILTRFKNASYTRNSGSKEENEVAGFFKFSQ